jgi:DHA1 family tetracycline resistance protein-like MFS transporter
MSLWGLASPATQALMSRQVDRSEQGRLQGAVTSLTSLAGIFAPFMFANVFGKTIGNHAILELPGSAFLLASMLVAAWLPGVPLALEREKGRASAGETT